MKRALLLVVLAGCTAAQPILPPVFEDTCGAGAFADLIGKDVTALETTLLLGPVRVIRPNDAVTMDFLPNRVNFIISDSETIQMIDCG